MAPLSLFLTLGLVTLNAVTAHPGHSVAAEAAERAAFVKRSPHSVRSCANHLRRRGHLDAAIVRRQALARKIRAEKNLHLSRRDFAQYNVSHASSSGVGLNSDETAIFTDDSSCILQPEVTQGPYYIDGELIREDITEDQEGVPLYLDIQIVDTSDCSAVDSVYMDVWHCNATGVYSGVSSSGNGNSGDESNLDNTFLRGIQETDSDGVAQFQTIFPGHYTGRATHIHVLTHNVESTVIQSNGTLLEGNFTTHASHVGQIFFDQDLISQVESTSVYSTNTQTLTENSDDTILASEATDMDPFVEYVLLGDDVSDGILAWITLGIDPSTDDEVTSAGTYYESGGVANSESSMGGGSGGGSGAGNMTGSGAPSGTAGGMPSGTAGGMPSGTGAANDTAASSSSISAASKVVSIASSSSSTNTTSRAAASSSSFNAASKVGSVAASGTAKGSSSSAIATTKAGSTATSSPNISATGKVGPATASVHAAGASPSTVAVNVAGSAETSAHSQGMASGHQGKGAGTAHSPAPAACST